MSACHLSCYKECTNKLSIVLCKYVIYGKNNTHQLVKQGNPDASTHLLPEASHISGTASSGHLNCEKKTSELRDVNV